jgi:hypothetical protein
MKKLIEFLLPICLHEWETEDKLDIYRVHPIIGAFDPNDECKNKFLPEKYRSPIGYCYILKCKKCGRIKKHVEYFKYDT